LNCFNPSCRFHITRRYEALAYLLGYWDGLDSSRAYGAAMRARDRAGEFLAKVRPERVEEELVPLSGKLADAHHAYLETWKTDRRDAYLIKARGLTRHTIRLGNLGYDTTRFTIPVYTATGLLHTLRYRLDPAYDMRDRENPLDRGAPKYSGIRGRNQPVVYPANLLQAWCDGATWIREALPSLPPTPYVNRYGEVWVVEGELDALRLWQEGIPTITITNGAGQVRKLANLLIQQFPSIKRVVVAVDQDAAGYAAQTELVEACDKVGLVSTVAYWPIEWGKDMTEVLVGGHSIRDIEYYGYTG
jgi:hypothetical protein